MSFSGLWKSLNGRWLRLNPRKADLAGCGATLKLGVPPSPGSLHLPYALIQASPYSVNHELRLSLTPRRERTTAIQGRSCVRSRLPLSHQVVRRCARTRGGAIVDRK